MDRGGSDVDAQAGSRRVLRVMMGCRSVSALCMERMTTEFGSMMPIVSLRDCVLETGRSAGFCHHPKFSVGPVGSGVVISTTPRRAKAVGQTRVAPPRARIRVLVRSL